MKDHRPALLPNQPSAMDKVICVKQR
ncbi:hypothetical protein Nmel_000144 [Mimus melanotis]